MQRIGDGRPAPVAGPEPAGAGAAAPAGMPRLPWPWAVLAAVTGGLALAGAFPPAGLWPLAAAGPALLVVALSGQRLRPSFGLGLLFGLAFGPDLDRVSVRLAIDATSGVRSGSSLFTFHSRDVKA